MKRSARLACDLLDKIFALRIVASGEQSSLRLAVGTTVIGLASAMLASAAPLQKGASDGLRIQAQERSEWVQQTGFSEDDRVALTVGSFHLYPCSEVVALWDMSSGKLLWRWVLELPMDNRYEKYQIRIRGFSSAYDPILEVTLQLHADKFEKSIIVLDHRSGAIRFRKKIAETSQVQISEDKKKIHEIAEDKISASYDIGSGADVGVTAAEDKFHTPFDGRWRNLEPGAPAIAVQLEGVVRRCQLEKEQLLLDGKRFMTLTDRMSVFRSPVAAGRAYLLISDIDGHRDGMLIDLIDLSVTTVPKPSWPEGLITLSSSPSGRILGHTAMWQNRTSDSSGDQFFGEVYAADGKLVRDPWPNAIRLFDYRLVELIDDRFLILGSARADQSDIRVRQMYCLDLLELRIRWSIYHNHDWTDQVLYSNGKDILLANRSRDGERRFRPNLAGSDHLVVRDVRSGRRRAVEEDFDWRGMVLIDQGYAGLREREFDPKLAFWLDGEMSITIAQAPPHDWIMYTEDGHFSASENGGQLVGVIDGVDSYRIDQFAARWNRPDIILERIGLAAPKYIDFVRDALQQQGRDLAATGRGDTWGPRAKILATELLDGNSLTVNFQGEASGAELRSLHLFVNGVPVFKPSGKLVSGAKYQGSETILLTPGANEVELSFTDTRGREGIRRHQRVVCRSSPQRDLYYLGIAVGEYDQPGVTDLKYTINDATDMATAVGTLRGYSKIHRKLLLERDVSARGLDMAAKWLAKAAPHDDLIVFVAGHGVYSDGTYYYLPATTEAERIAETGISFERFEQLLLSTPARGKLFLIDTCESGEAPARPVKDVDSKPLPPTVDDSRQVPDVGMRGRVAWRGASPAGAMTAPDIVLPGQFYFADLRRRTGAVVFSSCEWNEVALENSRWENGAFTEALVEALTTSAADEDGDGFIAKGELKNYVRQRVADMTSNRQHPTIDRDNPMQAFRFAPAATAAATGAGDRGWLPIVLTDAETNTGRPDRIRIAQDRRFAGTLSWGAKELVIEGSGGELHRFSASRRGGFFDPDDGSYHNVNHRCWPDGIIRYRKDSEPFFHHELWIEGRFNHVLPGSRVPLALDRGAPGYFATEDGTTWVWNNRARASDAAYWTSTPRESGRFAPPGDTDELGFAQGQGTLTWYKKKGDQTAFVVSYTGTMVDGKFEGKATTLDWEGTRGVRHWKNGRKVQ